MVKCRHEHLVRFGNDSSLHRRATSLNWWDEVSVKKTISCKIWTLAARGRCSFYCGRMRGGLKCRVRSSTSGWRGHGERNKYSKKKLVRAVWQMQTSKNPFKMSHLPLPSFFFASVEKSLPRHYRAINSDVNLLKNEQWIILITKLEKKPLIAYVALRRHCRNFKRRIRRHLMQTRDVFIYMYVCVCVFFFLQL